MSTLTKYPAEPNWIQRKFAAHLANQNKRLLALVLDSSDVRPLRTPMFIAGISAAIGVHLFTIGLFVGGVWLIVHNSPHFDFFELIGGLLCLGIGWASRPRLP